MSNVIPLRPMKSEAVWLDEFVVDTRDVPKVILSGLKAAGVRAEQGKVWRGKYPTTLELVIDIECPAGHLSYDRMSFAKVRLLVDPRKGTLTVHRDETVGNLCPRCDQQAIDRWLVTCQGHDENGHPDHEPGWIDVDDFADDTPDEVITRVMDASGDSWEWVRPDDSPMGRVFAAMEGATREFMARYDLAHPEYVEEQVRAMWEGQSEEFVQGKVAARMERAKALLSTGKKLIGSTEVEIEDWTEAKATEWLAEQNIPVTATYREAWALAKEIVGHPSKAMVEAGHRIRREAEPAI